MFATDVVARLVAASVVTVAQSGVAPMIQVPTTGKFLTVREYGGEEPDWIHNAPTVPSHRRPRAQVIARGADWDEAAALAEAAYLAVIARDEILSGTRYLYLVPSQEPFPLGLDDNGRPMVAFNIRGMKRP